MAVVPNEQVIEQVLAKVASHTMCSPSEIAHQRNRAKLPVLARTLVCGLLQRLLDVTPDQLAIILPVGKAQVYRYLIAFEDICNDTSGSVTVRRHQRFIEETTTELSLV